MIMNDKLVRKSKKETVVYFVVPLFFTSLIRGYTNLAKQRQRLTCWKLSAIDLFTMKV